MLLEDFHGAGVTERMEAVCWEVLYSFWGECVLVSYVSLFSVALSTDLLQTSVYQHLSLCPSGLEGHHQHWAYFFTLLVPITLALWAQTANHFYFAPLLSYDIPASHF